MRVVEVRVPLDHRATGTDLHSQLHRAHQLADVARALATRRPWRQVGERRAGELRPSRQVGAPQVSERAVSDSGGEGSDIVAAGQAGEVS